tara:strand:+ start:727 stop:921 length:195 start_codon:yes stop_codon:yes gene_type:complete
MKCCLCGGEIQKDRDEQGKVYWDRGQNALPIKNGRCCSKCNDLVIAVRMLPREKREIAIRTLGF